MVYYASFSSVVYGGTFDQYSVIPLEMFWRWRSVFLRPFSLAEILALVSGLKALCVLLYVILKLLYYINKVVRMKSQVGFWKRMEISRENFLDELFGGNIYKATPLKYKADYRFEIAFFASPIVVDGQLPPSFGRMSLPKLNILNFPPHHRFCVIII